jgi:hypothetical protein
VPSQLGTIARTHSEGHESAVPGRVRLQHLHMLDPRCVELSCDSTQGVLVEHTEHYRMRAFSQIAWTRLARSMHQLRSQSTNREITSHDDVVRERTSILVVRSLRQTVFQIRLESRVNAWSDNKRPTHDRQEGFFESRKSQTSRRFKTCSRVIPKHTRKPPGTSTA